MQYARSGDVSIAYGVVGDGPFDLVVGSGIRFEHGGSATLKGLPGEWQLYAVERPVSVR